MSNPDSERDGLFWRVLLIVAILSYGYALYAVETPSARLSLGVVLLVPIAWSAARLGVIEHVAAERQTARPIRRFNGLRTQVSQFLSEVKRLNWLAADFGRGASERSRILAEMDAIEDRLNVLVRKIREEAGKA